MQHTDNIEIAKLVERWIRPEIRAISAYHVPNASGLIKLDAMENPYTWPDVLRQEWIKFIRDAPINRYPDPDAENLKIQLREKLSIPRQSAILLGNGSDELIQILAIALGGSDKVIMALEPSFVMYRMIAHWVGSEYVGIPLKAKDFSIDIDAVLMAIEHHTPALIYIAYPNNPTGNLFTSTSIHRIINAAPGLVVVDEAYAPFTDASFIHEIDNYDNLLVLRTLSKMGLAGLRLGYLVGHPNWIKEFNKARMPYNINVLTQITAEFALKYKYVLDEQTNKIREERTRLSQELAKITNVHVYPSDANFILFKLPQAPKVLANLKSQGILIKSLHGTHQLLDNCLRVTVGTPEENNAFLHQLEKSLV